MKEILLKIWRRIPARYFKFISILKKNNAFFIRKSLYKLLTVFTIRSPIIFQNTNLLTTVDKLYNLLIISYIQYKYLLITFPPYLIK